MTDDLISRWADLLVDYCLRVMPGESIVLASNWEGWPLVGACARAVVLRGAYPLARFELPGQAEFFLKHATEAQLVHVPLTQLYEAEHADARIRIAAESNTRALQQTDPARQAAFDRARDPIRKAARRKRWVLTRFPTAAYATDAGMSLEDYEAFVASAMFLDRVDPMGAWLDLGLRQADLVKLMGSVQKLRIEADGTDIALSVAGRTWINSDGRRNMPSGEIFTGPLEDSASGRLRCSFPVCRGGRELEGIRLELESGRVVSARAERGEDYLLAMLDLDQGARRLGEIGLGLNYGIDKFTRSILYDEKIGGTAHLALGESYPETGATNKSALHWDLIIDLRNDGRITADGKVVMEKGLWRVA